jgi:hypothetical protein
MRTAFSLAAQIFSIAKHTVGAKSEIVVGPRTKRLNHVAYAADILGIRFFVGIADIIDQASVRTYL